MKDDDAIVRRFARAQVRLAAELKTLRAELGWSQEKTAEVCGLHEKFLSRLETGKANPTLLTLVALSSGLGAPLARLLDYPKDP